MADNESWRDLAERITNETDGKKMLDLVMELNNALENRQSANSSQIMQEEGGDGGLWGMIRHR
jgi:hypothetical protein